jgi:hypothetical protein
MPFARSIGIPFLLFFIFFPTFSRISFPFLQHPSKYYDITQTHVIKDWAMLADFRGFPQPFQMPD